VRRIEAGLLARMAEGTCDATGGDRMKINVLHKALRGGERPNSPNIFGPVALAIA
jgi:hypothetical protein